MARTINITDDDIVNVYREKPFVRYIVKHHNVSIKRVKTVLRKKGMI